MNMIKKTGGIHAYTQVIFSLCISAGLLTGCSEEQAPPAVNTPVAGAPIEAAYASSQNADFCRVAQTKISNTTLAIENIIYKDFESFKLSKPVGKPLTTAQFVVMGKHPKTGAEYPQQISCKMKTADSIIKYNGAGTAGADGDCKAIQQGIIDTALANLSATDKQLALKNRAGVVKAADDVVVWIGPRWLEPWPWPSASQTEAGKIAITSKALFVKDSAVIPMPDRFKGTHYCHLATPEYVRLLAIGEIPAPAAQP
jgi:hypothetical protein